MNKLIFLTPLLLLIMIGIAGATTPTVPSSIQYYVPLNLTNSQTTATSAPFQQMVNITESSYSSYINYNSNFANFEYFYANGTLIPSWIESNSSGKLVTWVKTVSIPASSNITIYLGFASKTTNLLSSTGTTGIGEAPQLSSTYAQYDDGASVFNNYWNFAGTSSSGWTIGGVGSATFNNGITLNSNGQGPFLVSSTTLSANSVIDGLMSQQAGAAIGIGTISGYAFDIGESGTQELGIGGTSSWGQITSWAIQGSSLTAGTQYIVTGYYAASGNLLLNYVSQLTTTLSPTTQDIVITGYSGSALTSFIQYLRTRAYPPNGAMPSVTFGAVQAQVSLSISPNPATYGQAVTLTATCPTGDSCAIDYPTLGTHIATGTTTATYTYSAFSLAAGSYSSFYAHDLTLATSSAGQTLTVNKNSTYTLTASIPASFVYTGGTKPATFTIGTHNNQLSGSFYLNGALVGTTTTTNTLGIGPALGSYNLVFNTTGNANYTAKSVGGSLTISAYKFLQAIVNTTAYETSSQGYDYKLNVSSLVSNVLLEQDGTVIAELSPTGTLPSTQWFNFSFSIPLLSANTVNTYNAVVSNSIMSTTVNSTAQTQLLNYFTSGGPQKNMILTGAPETFFINITQTKTLNKATVLNASLIAGNEIIPLQTILQYKYYYQYGSFVPSLYGLQNPVGKIPTSYPLTGKIELGFGNSIAWRNLTLSPLTLYNPYLVSCNASTPKAFVWKFYNATNYAQITTNSLLLGSFIPQLGLYVGSTINGSAAGLTTTATANTYSTCIYPSWASFNTSGTFITMNANYSDLQYMLINQKTDNVSQNLNVYMQQIYTPSSYDIVVERGTNNFISAVVQEMLHNYNTNQSVVVNTFQTPAGGGFVTNLQTGAYYQFKVYTNTGILLNTTSLIRASCNTGSTCVYYIEVSNTTLIAPVNYLNNLRFSCTITNSTNNRSIVSCSASSVNGAAFNVSLQVVKNSLISNDTACYKSLDAAALTLTCTLNDTNSTVYAARFWVTTPQYGQLTLDTFSFGTQPALFGSLGAVIALLVVMGFALAFIGLNPSITIILSAIGFIISGLAGLFVLGLAGLGFLLVFIAIIIYALSKGG